MRALSILAFALIGLQPALAQEPTLTITRDSAAEKLSAATLLARPDAAAVKIPDDVTYRHAMSYRAVPLLALLGDTAGTRFDTLQASATDGFSTQIPLALVTGGGATAWVAIEDPAHPWPAMPGSNASAGPFYLVWDHPERASVRTEQWPYALAGISFVESPVHRWPQLALRPNTPETASARRGQQVFLTQCFPCHRLKQAGTGEMGPDLGQPMNVTSYITDAGLRAIIRDPRAVRIWPTQLMKGFGADAMPDADVDAVVAYLHAIAGQ